MATEDVTALDATFLELEEADESAHMHIGSVAVFDPGPQGEAPEIGQLRARVASASAAMPRFRQRLSEPRTGGLHWPRWIEHESFAIADHVREVGLPAPGGLDELREWAGDYFSARLDRTRPLWEIILVKLGDGRWAMVSKTHHCMVDGVGSVDIAQAILDLEPDAERVDTANARTVFPLRAEPRPSTPMLAVPRAIAGLGLGLARAGVDVARGALSLAAGTVRTATHPEQARELARRAKALAGVVLADEVVGAPPTSINGPIGAARSLAVVEVPLADLKAIKGELGGTVNDAVLAGMAGSLRVLLDHRGEEPPEVGLRAMVPMNIRTAAERLELGNKITSLFVHLPVAEADPRRRYELQVEEAERLKAGDQAIGSRGMIDLAAHAPPVLHSFLAQSLFATRLFNITITNVPGPQFPLYAFGARMVEVWPLVPLAAEHALGVAIFSYDGRVFFCFNAARDAVPDLDVAAGGLAAAIDELRELAAASRAAA